MFNWRNIFRRLSPKSRIAKRGAFRQRVGASRDPLELAIELERLAASGVRFVRPGGGSGGGMGGAQIAARYDAAGDSDAHRKHWLAADNLSADAANSLAVRQKLRTRTRHEVGNNSYLKGMSRTLANDTVGACPRLQMLLASKQANTQMEGDFADWARAVKLGKKMRVMRKSKLATGEVLAVFFGNPKLEAVVKLDFQVVEADRLTDPTYEHAMDPQWCDGIRYDEYGNPLSYRILHQHPGDPFPAPVLNNFTDYDAGFVYHYFEEDRPGQRRGVPELTPSVQTGAQLRRYDSATLSAAETASRIALTLETPAPAIPPEGEQEEESAPSAMDTVELPESGALTLPGGSKLNGFKAEQPTDRHKDFVDVKLRETARCVDMPFTIAALDSSNSNLSARYLDSQIYAKSIGIERSDLESEFMLMLMKLWLREYGLRTGRSQDVRDYPHNWVWPTVTEHADPDKVAAAQAQRLKNGTSSIPEETAAMGQDWEEVFDKQARALGITVAQLQALYRRNLFGTADPDGKADATPNGGGPGQGIAVPLNGAQIEGALSILTKLREQAIGEVAAAELLAGLGIDAGRAKAVARDVSKLDTGAGDVEFRRQVLLKLLDVPAAREAYYNKIDAEDLVTQTGLPPEAGYEVPWIPVETAQGQLVSGDVIEDPEGDTVGGNVLPDSAGRTNAEDGAGQNPPPKPKDEGNQQ